MGVFDNRQFPRKRNEVIVQILQQRDYSHYRNDKNYFLPVTVFNQSEEGLYFEANRPLNPGTIISIKMITPEESRSKDVYPIHYGRVAWCKQLDDTATLFGIGVRVAEKMVRAKVQFSHLDSSASISSC